jgi:methionyl-tRNA formyltransferase
MRFGFVTCVELGLACMQEIHKVGGRLDLGVTLLDERARQKAGRVYLDDFCAEEGVPLVKTRHVNDPQVREAVAAYDLDWLFIIGWSQIAGADLLRAPRNGVLGMHPTLLPEGRGRAAIPWAILKGLKHTGVTLFKLDEGVDTGPILAQEVLHISPDETATTLYSRVTKAHRSLIRSVWKPLSQGLITPVPQDERLATTWPGRHPEDGRFEFTWLAEQVDRLIRATTRPYPGAFVDIEGRRLRVWAAAWSPEKDAMRLDLRDRTLWATDYAWEPL